MYLKEHRQVALHVACGDITDVEMRDGKLIINVLERMIVSLLEEGKREIERALRWQGLELEVVVNLKEQESSLAEKDEKRLKEVFENVTIIEKRNKLIWR